MKKTTLLRSACAIAVSLSFAPVSLIAQAADDAQAKVERIEVTGSRIKRTDIEGPSPVQSLSKDDIANMGFDNLQQ